MVDKVVVVKWIDTVSSGDSWEEEHQSPAEIFSCGFLHYEDAQYLTLVLSISEDGLIRGYVSIPKEAILNRKEIADFGDN